MRLRSIALAVAISCLPWSSAWAARIFGDIKVDGKPLPAGVPVTISHPLGEGGTVRAGVVQINGVAFSGTSAVRLVEVSVDGGKSWKEAQFLGPDLGKYAWRQFILPVTLKPGNYTLVSRAVDEDGHEQPAERMENHRAYAHNGWRDHGVKITVS